MIGTGLGEILLRQVPAHLVSGVRSGELAIHGSIIHSLATGRIVAHLQETSGLARVAGTVLGGSSGLPLPGIGLAVQLAGQGVAIAQNEQIKAAIDVVQNLQIANLAVGAVGIGVSAVGFAVVSAKLQRVEASLEGVSGKLEAIGRGLAILRKDQIAEDFVRLRTAAEQMDEGWLLADPAPQWRRVASESHAVSNIFEGRVAEMLAGDSDPEAVDPFLEAYAIAVGTRVSARLAAGDDVVARRAAEEGAQTLISFGERFQSSAVTLKRLTGEGVEPGTKDWGEKLETVADAVRGIVSGARQRATAAAGTALTVSELERQSIKGRTWLECARAEDSSPVICLVPTAS